MSDTCPDRQKQLTKLQKLQQTARAEQTARPWVIFLNGKHYCRAASHRETLSISKSLARMHKNATITQRYEGRNIDHMSGGKGYD
jgi:hypothetical protein